MCEGRNKEGEKLAEKAEKPIKPQAQKRKRGQMLMESNLFFSSPVGAVVDLILPTQPSLCHS